MSRFVTVLGVLAILVLSMGFAALNGGQLVTLRLGVVTFYRIPLTLVAFGALILGMLVMLVASIHSDLKVRRILRERLAAEDEAERSRIFVDRAQQDLFEEEAGAAGPASTGPSVPPAPPTPDPGSGAPADAASVGPPAADPATTPDAAPTPPPDADPVEGRVDRPRQDGPPERPLERRAAESPRSPIPEGEEPPPDPA